MGIFDFMRKRGDKRFAGCWHPIRVEGSAQIPDDIELDFQRGGRLNYAAKYDSIWKVTQLNYHLENSVIVYSNGVRTGFAFESNGTLRLDSADNCTWYQRGPKKAPQQ